MALKLVLKEYPPEELLPELAQRLIVNTDGSAHLNHPLMYLKKYNAEGNRLYNTMYREKLGMLSAAQSKGRYDQCVELHEPHFRQFAFEQYREKMSNKVYWRLLGDLYRLRVPQVGGSNDWWIIALTEDRDNHELLHEPEDREALADMADEVLVYSIIQTKTDRPTQWTPNRSKANMSAARKRLTTKSDTIMLVGQVNKKDILAFDSKVEHMVINPFSVKVQEAQKQAFSS